MQSVLTRDFGPSQDIVVFRSKKETLLGTPEAGTL
jgi:hypothetical protein